MRLVHNDTGVFVQVWFYQRLSEQHTIRHVFDLSLLAGAVLETNGIYDLTTQLDLHLFADALCNTHSCNATRLCTPDKSLLCVAILKQELGQLSRLSRARLTDDDDDLVVSNDAQEIFADCKGGKVLSLLP